MENGYSKYRNPYHNLIHAADVLQTTYQIVYSSGLMVEVNTVFFVSFCFASRSKKPQQANLTLSLPLLSLLACLTSGLISLSSDLTLFPSTIFFHWWCFSLRMTRIGSLITSSLLCSSQPSFMILNTRAHRIISIFNPGNRDETTMGKVHRCFSPFRSDVALIYNDRAVLENHHVSAAFRLMRIDDYNIVSEFTTDEYKWETDAVLLSDTRLAHR